jgi:hypothetical protein
MRAAGEENFRSWMLDRQDECPAGLIVFCVLAQALLIAGLGIALVLFSGRYEVPFGIGIGMLGYASAMAFYTLYALLRNRRRPRFRQTSPE